MAQSIGGGRVRLNNGQIIQAQQGGWYDGQQFWNDTLSNPGQINPQSDQVGAGSYVNGSQPQTDTSQSSNEVTTAEDIIKPYQDQLKEQQVFLKEFLDKNPLGFDEVLTKQIAQDKFKPYYQQILNDFVQPLQTKISQSTEDQTRLLGELVRQRGVGSKDIQTATENAINSSREGFAGAGLLGSGIESGVTGRQNITGTNKLNDFLAGNEFQQTQTTLEQTRAREDAQRLIDQKNRDIFGKDRAYEMDVADELIKARGVALRKNKLNTLEAISSRFGAPLPEIPAYLDLYNV